VTEHEQDRLLTAAFAEADSHIADEDFVRRVMLDVERSSRAQFRVRALQSAAMWAAVGAALWIVAPVLAQASAVVSVQAADVASSPVALACGIAVAAIARAGTLRFG